MHIVALLELSGGGMMHTDDLRVQLAAKLVLLTKDFVKHPDLGSFFPDEASKEAPKYKDVNRKKKFEPSPTTATAHDKALEIKRVLRNEMLPIWHSVCRALGYVNSDGHTTVPSGKQIAELLESFLKALYTNDQQKKASAKAAKEAGIKVKQEKEGKRDVTIVLWCSLATLTTHGVLLYFS